MEAIETVIEMEMSEMMIKMEAMERAIEIKMIEMMIKKGGGMEMAVVIEMIEMMVKMEVICQSYNLLVLLVGNPRPRPPRLVAVEGLAFLPLVLMGELSLSCSSNQSAAA